MTFTSRPQGDFAVDADPDGLTSRRRAVVDRPWVWLRQVHGAGVVVVRAADGPVAAEVAARWAGSEADAVVTDRADVAVAVQTADCAPVLFASPEGVVGAVHAGWRGLEAGVVGRAVDAARGLGASELHAVLGPCIHATSYRFGDEDLERLADRFGAEVRGRTIAGDPALDLPAGVDAALAEAGVGPAERIDVDTAAAATACHSHRARGDRGRQSAVAWVAS